MENQLRIRICHQLESFLFENAVFLSERLCAEYPNEENLFLLATCHARQGKSGQTYAHRLLQGTQSEKCRYLLAYCAYVTGNLVEAENVLLEKTDIPSSGLEEYKENVFKKVSCIPNGAAGLHLLGKICQESHRYDHAAEYFRLSLKVEPCFFSSWIALCDLGRGDGFTPTAKASGRAAAASNNKVTAGEYFEDRGTSKPKKYNLRRSSAAKRERLETPPSKKKTPFDDMTISPIIRQSPSFMLWQESFGATTPPSSSIVRKEREVRRKEGFGGGILERVALFDEDCGGISPIDRFSPSSNTAIDLDMIDSDREISRGSKYAVSGHFQTASHRPQTATASRRLDQNRHAEHNAGSGAATRSHTKTPRSSKNQAKRALPMSGGSRSACRLMLSPTQKPSSVSRSKKAMSAPLGESKKGQSLKENNADESEQDLIRRGDAAGNESLQAFTQLLATVGYAYQLLSSFRCQEAVDAFNALPSRHLNTGWVLNQVGNAYYHMGDYESAIRAFQKMISMEPFRMEGLEIYSSCLWHLDEQAELMHLTRRLLDFDRHHPITCCVAGNCFSKEKDRAQALKLFRNAVQLAPRMAYAHSLCGHECVAMEDFDKATESYRIALSINERNYSAWFGIGEIMERQEKYKLAEVHFKRGLAVNPYCVPIRCHLASLLCHNQQFEAALELLNVNRKLPPKLMPPIRYRTLISNACTCDSDVFVERNARLKYFVPECRFEKARVLESMNRFEETLHELRLVESAVPREASVHFWIGRLCKALNRTEDAVKHLTIAQSLNPKDNTVRTFMEQLSDSNDIDWFDS